MVKTSRVDENGVKRGAWSEEEDDKLRAYIQRYGHWNWSLLPKFAGLSRSGKSCRLRWVNYLRPDMKHGNFTREEDDMIIHLHTMLGNKWSAIAAKLPGRSDNEVKNRWNTHLKKRAHDDHIVIETDHRGTTMQPTDQKENQELQLQNEVEMNLAGESLDSPSCSTRAELSSCWFSGLDCGVSSNVGSQMFEDYWTEPFIEDITSSVDYNILSPLNVVDDLIAQSSCKGMTTNDDFSWSMLDSYDEYNNGIINCWDI